MINIVVKRLPEIIGIDDLLNNPCFFAQQSHQFGHIGMPESFLHRLLRVAIRN